MNVTWKDQPAILAKAKEQPTLQSANMLAMLSLPHFGRFISRPEIWSMLGLTHTRDAAYSGHGMLLHN